MERLEIRNFLTIQEADIDVKRFTILIGPQASGKSIIAKLLYFFREFLNKQFIRSIRNFEDKRDLQKASLEKFEQLLPLNDADKQEFSIVYRCGEVEVVISRKLGTGKQFALHLDYSENLAVLHREAQVIYLQSRQQTDLLEQEDTGFFEKKESEFSEVIINHVYKSEYKYAFRPSVFIPASRSFFANLQQNVFSFLANNIPIDPLIKEFGSVYELSKARYSRCEKEGFPIFALTPQQVRDWPLTSKFLLSHAEKVLAGKYFYEKEQDWIVTERGHINLVNASSGQQEALPMLIVLLTRPLYSSQSRPVTFFIEEPEAHLFPFAQKNVVELLVRLHNLTGCNYLITTHSPYILTALNNLIYARNLSQQNNEALREQINGVVPSEIQVSFDDVSAYTIEDGKVKSILDPELNMIGASVIDEVSNEFDAVFSKLLELEATHG
jgi:AAA15 family ATPase/GTPase